MKTPSVSVEFWTQAFAGATPPSALGLALKEGLVPASEVATHGEEWASSWLSGMVNRMTDAYDLAHRPWRQFGGAGRSQQHQMTDELPLRLNDVKAGTVDAGLLSVFQGFVQHGVTLNQPVEAITGATTWAHSLLEAAVAMNVPSVIDWAATLPDKKTAKELDAMTAPLGTMGERNELPWLHVAALGWQDTLLEAMIDYGLDPNQPNRQGQTPLFFARTERAVKSLVAAGANPLHQDKHGRTAIQHWEQVKDFPWPSDAKKLALVVGDAAQSSEVVSSKAVLYIGKGPYSGDPATLKKWWDEMPVVEGPLHAARMNPGGTWKGQWSPAAWVGLQGLQGNLYYSYHLASLLDRPDFLSPEPVVPKGKLSERGLLGLGLLKVLDKYPKQKPSEHDRQGHQGNLWNLACKVEEVLGENWLERPEWLEPIYQTSKALLDVKATPNAVREYVNEAWCHRFSRISQRDANQGQALWDARVKGSVQFNHWETWSPRFSALSPGLAATFFLLATHDLLEKEIRERPHSSVNDVIEYGRDIKTAWRQTIEHFKKSDGFETLSPDLDKTIEAIITKLSSYPSLSDDAAFLRQRHLEKTLAPVVNPAKRGPRL